MEVSAALEHARSEKIVNHEKALTRIQSEENQAWERCKVSLDVSNQFIDGMIRHDISTVGLGAVDEFFPC